MAEKTYSNAAKRVYKDVQAYFDSINYKYTVDDEKLRVYCNVTGDDLDIKLNIDVGGFDGFISVYSPMPFTISESKRAVVADAVTLVNYDMINGCFDYDLRGNLGFRITQCYHDSILDRSVYHYLINLAIQMIDKFNDKFLMMSLGKYSIDELIAFLKH